MAASVRDLAAAGHGRGEIARRLATRAVAIDAVARRHGIVLPHDPQTTAARSANARSGRAQAAATQHRISASKRRMRAARPQTREELDALVAAALAAGRVTSCPPAACAPVGNGQGFDNPVVGLPARRGR